MKYKGITITKEMLSAPELLALIEKDTATVRKAVDCLSKVNECVCPIYTTIRGGPNRAPKYIGCGAVVVVDQLFYLLTAAHVVQPDIDNLLIGVREAIFKMPHWRFFTSSMRAKAHGLTPIDDDVAIIPLRGDIPAEIRSIALTEDHFDFAIPPNDATTHGIIGFLESESGVKRLTLTDGLTTTEVLALTGHQRPMVTYELPNAIYDQVGFDRRTKLVLSYVAYRLNNGNLEKTQTPRGMSGGAIFRIIGLPSELNRVPSSKLVPKLAGIFQERREERESLPAISIGARLNVYLDLIEAYVRKNRRDERAENSVSLTFPISGTTPYSSR